MREIPHGVEPEHRGEALRDLELAAWVNGSRRFRAFAETHRDKIRKKLRGAVDPDARRDVRAELAVARLLLDDRRIELAFEGYGSGNPGPDFTVLFRGARSFNLEVTRPRRGGAGAAATILAKLRQLPPSVPNALLVAIEGESAATFDMNDRNPLIEGGECACKCRRGVTLDNHATGPLRGDDP